MRAFRIGTSKLPPGGQPEITDGCGRLALRAQYQGQQASGRHHHPRNVVVDLHGIGRGLRDDNDGGHALQRMVCAALNAPSDLCSAARRACSTMPKLSSQTPEGVNAE